MNALAEINGFHADMTAWRRDIHAHPELGFEETRTAGIVAEKLRAFGFDEVHTGVGRTGVVGVLRAGTSRRSMGLRADMDALPMAESNTFAHRSNHAQRMHACGHDGHTTMLMGAARYLAATRRFDGVVNFIFQPAEEGLGGAAAMVADGLFQRFPCDSIFGMHNRPSLAVGHFNVKPGPMMAGAATFDIHIHGKGAHGARPETGIDPVMAAAHMAVALQTVVSRNVAPLDSAVLSVTLITAGSAYNLIPQTAHMAGTVRSFSKPLMQHIEASMRRVIAGVAQAMGASAEFTFKHSVGPTINNPEQAAFAADICEELVGAAKVNRNPPLVMGSEDFSAMLDLVPGCYLNIGNGGAEGGCEVHNPGYDFNDAALPLGAAFFARAVETRLRAA